MTETFPRGADPQELERADHEHVRAALGALSVEHVDNLVASFHGGESHYLGRPLDQPETINSIVPKTDGQGRQTNEVVGHGNGTVEALYDTFLNMRRLETVKTKPLMRMEIQDGADVDLTTLEHYAPRVAPTAEAYRVPEYVQDLVDGNKMGRKTYDRTMEVEGWDKQLFSQVERFTRTSRGTELVNGLKIRSLQTLTPEQAVKLTLSMVHDLSKYSYDASGDADLEAARAADKKTAMQLLEEGFAHKDDPAWKGNGVCRNIASNVKSVFESLKQNQTTVNMLRNTYVGYIGSDEDFRIKKRENRGDSTPLVRNEPAHAWNTFTTVDGKGDASVTIVDVTWSLSKSPEEAIDNMDYTMTRSARKVRDLFERSADKSYSFHDFTNYYNKFLGEGFRKHHETAEFESMIDFAMREYLTAARTALDKADPEWIEKGGLPIVPGYMQGAASRLGDNLGKEEFETLFRLSEAGSVPNFDSIFDSYIKGGKNIVVGGPSDRAESLAFNRESLAKVIIGTLDPVTTKKYADTSSKFRVMARKYAPDLLEPFDPAHSYVDKKELEELARQSGFTVAMSSPSMAAMLVNNGLLKAANGDSDRVAQVTAGRDLYDKVANYKSLVAELSR